MLTKMMKQLKNKFNTPTWYVLTVMVILTALILYGIIYPGVLYTKGIFLDSSLYGNPNVLGKIQPNRSYADLWNELDIISAFFCLFMGFVCFILGVARSINRLGGRHIYMLALFLGLFGVNTLALVKVSASYVSQTILFYTYWLTYFTYPAALFIHIYSYFDDELKMWIWPVLAMPITYLASAIIAHFTCGFPFEIFGKLFNSITAFCLISVLLAGVFNVKQKPMLVFVRAVSGFWIVWGCNIGFKILSKHEGYYFHNEYKTGITVTAIIIVCFIIFTNASELFSYKYDLRMLSLQNQLVLESYEQTKFYVQQMRKIKHDLVNHYQSVLLLYRQNEHEKALHYLEKLGETAAEVTPHGIQNILVDSIIYSKLTQAQGISVVTEITVPSELPYEDNDVCSLLVNILDNALESCALCQQPELTLKIFTANNQMFINCKNSKSHAVLVKNGKMQTSKTQRQGHGFGLSIIDGVAEKYGGTLLVDYDDESFTLNVAIPL